jgi:hypothetical protein
MTPMFVVDAVAEGRLDGIGLTVYAALRSNRNNKSGLAWTSLETLAVKIGFRKGSKRNISRYLRQLMDIGAITAVEARRGLTTVFSFNDEPPAAQDEAAEEISTGTPGSTAPVSPGVPVPVLQEVPELDKGKLDKRTSRRAAPRHRQPRDRNTPGRRNRRDTTPAQHRHASMPPASFHDILPQLISQLGGRVLDVSEEFSVRAMLRNRFSVPEIIQALKSTAQQAAVAY